MLTKRMTKRIEPQENKSIEMQENKGIVNDFFFPAQNGNCAMNIQACSMEEAQEKYNEFIKAKQK